MDQLPRIRERIDSISGLQDLVGALRAMAGVHLREAQEAFAGTRAYVKTVERAISAVAPLTRRPATRGDGPSLLLAICSEHGFVGGFNKEILQEVKKHRAPDEELRLVGQRGASRANEIGLAAQTVHPMTSRVGGIAGLARRISAGLAGASTVRIVFATYRSGAGFEPTIRPILPLNPGDFADETPRQPPLHHQPPDALMESLAAEFLFAEVASALMESLASENGARLRAMEAASRNIDDRLQKLRSEQRVIRQADITSDLLDVVTGAEAVAEE